METRILIEAKDNKIIFKLILPFDLIDKNSESYVTLDETIIYECSNLEMDFNEFFKNINNINQKIKIAFPNEKNILDSNNLNFFINADLINDQNLIYSFIKKYKNFNITLNVDDHKNLIETLKADEYPNLKIFFNNSDKNIPYKEFYLMFSKLNEIVEFINHYNLSPLEKVLLVYDIVKANEYKAENKEEDYSVSRDLNQIINNDKIVCVGFSNLMDFLLTNLGMECNKINLTYKDKNSGHQRNYIHLKDKKYNINGIFFLDATWDSKTNENYIDNYRCFLKPINFFKRINSNEIIDKPTYFSLFNKDIDEILNEIKNKKNFDFVKLSVTLSTLLKKINEKENFVMLFGDDFDKIEKIINRVFKYYNKRIDEESFKNALYKVRRIEYINNIIKKEPNEEYIDSVCEKNYRRNAEYRLLQAIFGYDEPTLDTDLEEIKAESIDQDLLRMRLLKALKTKLNDFPENDYIKKM